MGNLSELIAKQKAAKEAQNGQPTPPVSESTVRPRFRNGSKVQPDQHSQATDVADSVSSTSSASTDVPSGDAGVNAGTNTNSGAAVSGEPKRPALLARFGTGRGNQGSNAGSDKPVDNSTKPQDADARGPQSVSGTIDSLDDLANSTAGEAIRESNGGAMMLGETAATAPTRDLPEDMEDGMRLFVQSLDSLYDTLFDSELFSSVTRNIMQELADNREYKKLIADDDVHIMIKGMREAMGLARVKKVETKARKPASTAKRGGAKVSDDDLALLESLTSGMHLD